MVHGGDAPGWAAEGWEELAPGVGRCRLPGWDCTAGLVMGAAGALLVDAGSTLGEGAALRGAAGRLLGGGRVTHLALTHPHFDHVLGAGAFADAEVIAAPGAARELTGAAGRAALHADAVDHGVAREDAAAATAALRAPRREVGRPYELDLGGGTVALLVDAGPGHTAGDLVVLVRPRSGPPVLFCGDLVEESGPPQAGPDAQPDRWPAALDGLLALGGEAARYVPGHGAVVDAAFVRAQRAALAAAFPGSA
ncbi:MBL fold metallo-hydrolase [Streptomyces montanisoli]|uniref:MBL fold metallo-hydrolase n=1 Tax=Streptomyces montanisoli TaxID=2798581 RepID=A0A940MKV0_9ACTN|nr:MBL fold metallo-hydrolase [Streptomyces montanisoli]MBP0461206.1 MBL fold metallo-hydrolase [Streptomyces montanisoli]